MIKRIAEKERGFSSFFRNTNKERRIFMNGICRRRIFYAVSALFITLLTVFLLLPGKAAAETITSTINLVNVKQNERGDGYEWANRYDILTLNGLHVDTENDYGLRLPQNCTVVLKGTNYIKAGKYALSCSGNVSFKGNGTLILDAGEIGLFIYSEVKTDKIRLLEGNYQITAGKYGVYSKAADFSFVSGKMDIAVDATDGAAVSGRCLNLVGGRFTANNSVEASHELVVKGVNLDISSTKAALSAKNLTIRDISVTDYNGETSIQAKSTEKNERKSVIFGDTVSGVVDYVLLAFAVIGIAALIVVPILRKKKKTKELYERLAREKAEKGARA